MPLWIPAAIGLGLLGIIAGMICIGIALGVQWERERRARELRDIGAECDRKMWGES